MSISTYTKDQQNTIFNPNDFIDSEYISKSEADIRFLNANQNLEKMFGSMTITGDETVTNQFVTGNSTISGNETIMGTIKAGNDNNATGNEFKHQGIHGHVWLGDSVTDTTTTVLSKFTAGGNGYKNINLNGAITNINTSETSSSTQLNIGRAGSVHTTTIKGNVNLGDENSSGVVNALGEVTLGWAKPINIRGSNVSINIEPNSGPTTIGKAGLVANVANGQTNTLLSSQNKIYNPRLCDNTGNLLGQGFNLNNPSHFVFNQNLKFSSSTYTYCDTSFVKNVNFFINTPTLVNNQCYTMIFDFNYFLISGKGATGGASITPNSSTLTTTNYTGTASRVIQSSFALILAKSSGGDNPYTFTYISTSQSANPFTAFTFDGAASGTTTTPLGFSKGTTDGRIRVNIQFPQMTQNTYSTANNFMISMGASLRLCNSNVQGTDLNGNGYGIYPNHISDSFGGSAFFSLA